MIDPSIALSGKPADVATPLLTFTQGLRQKKQDRRQEEMDVQTKEMNTLKIAAQKYENFDAREKSRVDSVTRAAAELGTYLETGDIEGAKNYLTARRKRLGQDIAGGLQVDTRETDEALAMLSSNDPKAIETLKGHVGQLTKLGQYLGSLKTDTQMSGKGGNSVFNQVMAQLDSDPETKGLSTMEKIRIAQNKVGTNLTIGPNGEVMDMQGAAGSLGRLAQGEEGGKQTAKDQHEPQRAGAVRQQELTQDLSFKPDIAGGEAKQRQQQELAYARPIAEETAGGKSAAELQGNRNKVALQSGDNIAIIQEILTPDETGRTILDKATGSGAGAIYAGGKQFFGKSDESTQANAQLEIYGGKLLNNVPRMEGPQSDADLKSYKEQAGKVADPTIPAGDKKAALEIIAQLAQKYAAQNTSGVQPIPRSPPDESTLAPLSDEEASRLPPSRAMPPALSPPGVQVTPSGVKYRVVQ